MDLTPEQRVARIDEEVRDAYHHYVISSWEQQVMQCLRDKSELDPRQDAILRMIEQKVFG
jgi:hypothetical protein